MIADVRRDKLPHPLRCINMRIALEYAPPGVRGAGVPPTETAEITGVSLAVSYWYREETTALVRLGGDVEDAEIAEAGIAATLRPGVPAVIREEAP
jgi:hypothetical protein